MPMDHVSRPREHAHIRIDYLWGSDPVSTSSSLPGVNSRLPRTSMALLIGGEMALEALNPHVSGWIRVLISLHPRRLSLVEEVDASRRREPVPVGSLAGTVNG